MYPITCLQRVIHKSNNCGEKVFYHHAEKSFDNGDMARPRERTKWRIAILVDYGVVDFLP